MEKASRQTFHKERRGTLFMKSKRQLQQMLLAYYEQMVFVFEALSPEEKADLEEFERKRPADKVATSDWPGWEKHIGKRPIPRRVA